MVIAIDKYEREHGYQEDRSNCLKQIQDLIPMDVHRTAEAIRQYLFELPS